MTTQKTTETKRSKSIKRSKMTTPTTGRKKLNGVRQESERSNKTTNLTPITVISVEAERNSSKSNDDMDRTAKRTVGENWSMRLKCRGSPFTQPLEPLTCDIYFFSHSYTKKNLFNTFCKYFHYNILIQSKRITHLQINLTISHLFQKFCRCKTNLLL